MVDTYDYCNPFSVVRQWQTPLLLQIPDCASQRKTVHKQNIRLTPYFSATMIKPPLRPPPNLISRYQPQAKPGTSHANTLTGQSKKMLCHTTQQQWLSQACRLQNAKHYISTRRGLREHRFFLHGCKPFAHSQQSWTTMALTAMSCKNPPERYGKQHVYIAER